MIFAVGARFSAGTPCPKGSGGGSSTVLNVKRARNRKGKKKKGYEARISLGVNS